MLLLILSNWYQIRLTLACIVNKKRLIVATKNYASLYHIGCCIWQSPVQYHRKPLFVWPYNLKSRVTFMLSYPDTPGNLQDTYQIRIQYRYRYDICMMCIWCAIWHTLIFKCIFYKMVDWYVLISISSTTLSYIECSPNIAFLPVNVRDDGLNALGSILFHFFFPLWFIYCTFKL